MHQTFGIFICSTALSFYLSLSSKIVFMDIFYLDHLFVERICDMNGALGTKRNITTKELINQKIEEIRIHISPCKSDG